jgi:ABC-type uncharacterized transport system permease subunit
VTLTLANLLFGATSIVYLTASILFVAELMGHGGRLARFAPTLVGLGVPLHAAHIVVWSLVLNVCPVEGIHFALSVASMALCLAYALTRRRFRVDLVGVFVAPQALAFLLASRFVGGVADEPRLRGALLPFHVVSNMVGIALFAVACGAAVAYLLEEGRLKDKRLAVAGRLAAVDALDRYEHRFLVAGFPMLTIGILTGTIFAHEVETGGPGALARAAFSYAAWLLIGTVLVLRSAAGWRGRRAAFGTIVGFGLTMVVLALYLLRIAGGPSAGWHA